MIPWVDESAIKYEFGYKKSFFENLQKDGVRKAFFILRPSCMLGTEFVSKTADTISEIAKSCKVCQIQPLFVFNMKEYPYSADTVYCIPKNYDALKRLLAHFGEAVYFDADTISFNKPILGRYRDEYLFGFSNIDLTSMYNNYKNIAEREEYYKTHPNLIKFRVPFNMSFIERYDFCYSDWTKVTNLVRECYLRSRLNGCPFLLTQKDFFDDSAFSVSENKDIAEFDKSMERYCKEYSIEFIETEVAEYFAENVVNDIKSEW